jgi:hypothetical protein
MILTKGQIFEDPLGGLWVLEELNVIFLFFERENFTEIFLSAYDDPTWFTSMDRKEFEENFSPVNFQTRNTIVASLEKLYLAPSGSRPPL